ncbi:hypothetical protein ILUMI_09444 [Ignelater luminosus]|uniref:ABC transmembrane type-1 domain-containing protein n=1 Tax=Ignelater luminosus TaxID=2038154 RepID=A0A8K0D5S9_IGNLU|nr:hypothetical protein ILUMI_09444 [Ignelater luminosus]
MERNQKVKRLPNRRKGANFLSVLTFAFTLPTFRQGYRRDLEEDDITEHLAAHDSKSLGNKLEDAWNKELKLHKKPSLYRALLKVFGIELFFLGLIVFFLELVVKISQPLALSQLIIYYTQAEDEELVNKSQALMYAGVIVGASFINVLAGHSYMLCLQHFGMKLRVAFCSLVYRKSLRLSKSVLGGTTIGQMVNLLSNDVNRCDRAVIHLHHLWLSPLETVVIVGILYNLLGLTSTVGILFMALFVPLQMYMGKKTSEYRLKTALKTDERVRLMNEIISGIQVIKMYTWEKPFAKLVATVRR